MHKQEDAGGCLSVHDLIKLAVQASSANNILPDH